MLQPFAARSRNRGKVSRPDSERGHLEAILFVDVCDSSRAMRRDEGGALRGIVRALKDIEGQVADNSGQVCNTRGDGLFATFNSAHDAVLCALAIQSQTPPKKSTPRLVFRVAVHIGETFTVGGQVLGDSVNVTARIEAITEPGGILVSRPVYEALRGDPLLRFSSVGKPFLKNIGNDLELFQVATAIGKPRTEGLEMRLLGDFALSTAERGEIAVPPEGQLLFAALVLAPNGTVRRQWLQDTLWAHCALEERAGGLEAGLEALRRALGSDVDTTLQIDAESITLRPEAITSDVAAAREQGWQKPGPVPDLLSNCRPESETARDWLLRERRILRNSICLQATESGVLAAPTPIWHGAEPSDPLSSACGVGILPPIYEGDETQSGWLADLVADWLGRSLAEVEAVEIHDYRMNRRQPVLPSADARAPGPDILIQCRAATMQEMAQLSITALRTEDRKVIWSQSVLADRTTFRDADWPRVTAFVSYAADVLLSALASGRHMRDPAAHRAAKTAIGAVHRLLNMTGPGLDRVEADILAAYQADPKPIYLAWLAYMATFQVGERYGARDATLEEQARAMARKALEADPHNALVLGLVAHVHSYIFHEFAFADDLIARAIESNPACALPWDSASLLYAYTGRAAESMQAALNARRLGRHSPYRHLFDGACCVAAAVNGNFKDAVNYGESVIAMQPQFKAVLRYLAACYGHLGDTERAHEVMNRLMELEPDLSVERLRDRSYPVPSRTNVELIEKGLVRVGLRRNP